MKEWTIPSVDGQEKVVAGDMEKIIAPLVGSEFQLNEMITAVTEACLNAMEHGNGMKPRAAVKVQLQSSPSAFIVTTFDEGNGFLPTAMEEQRNIWNNEEHTRGWGLYFMRSFSDQLQTGWENGRFFVQMHFLKEK